MITLPIKRFDIASTIRLLELVIENTEGEPEQAEARRLIEIYKSILG